MLVPAYNMCLEAKLERNSKSVKVAGKSTTLRLILTYFAGAIKSRGYSMCV